jgi:hypothetical protein
MERNINQTNSQRADESTVSDQHNSLPRRSSRGLQPRRYYPIEDWTTLSQTSSTNTSLLSISIKRRARKVIVSSMASAIVYKRRAVGVILPSNHKKRKGRRS